MEQNYQINTDGKIVFNVSQGLPNYSQRNNEYVLARKNNIIRNTNTCNTTSMCMAASYAGWRFPTEPFPELKQEEDRLTAFILQDSRVAEYYKKTLPTLYKEWENDVPGAIPPNQVHRVLAYGTNLFFGSTVVKFREDVTTDEIIYEIYKKSLPVVVSGKFPKASNSLSTIDHIVVAVGLVYAKDYDIPHNPESFIVDDPWGNFMEGYEKILSGNDVICPYSKFLSYLKPVNSSKVKWAHLLTKGEAII